MNARQILFAAAIGMAPLAKAITKPQADSLLAAGQQLYIAGDHQGALNALLTIEADFDSPALQLSIGNAWYKLGNIPNAILHFERGLLLDPSDADLRANRDLANSQVKDKLPGAADHAFARRWQELRAGSDPDQWALRALWLMTITCLLIISSRLIRSRPARRAAQVAAAMCAMLLMISIAFAAARHRHSAVRDTAIIMAPRMDARAEPAEGAKPLFILHKGAKVEVRDSMNGWNEVRLPNGSVGWMPASAMERI
ncbi:MAG: hypothetical protein IPJ85_09475 [Flavobacteriales bacterium]|nr:hypothetical protein [Flavobacteriales bacterium]